MPDSQSLYERTGAAMSVTWDPAVYLRHADDRARPFHDLIARVHTESPASVVDLGCGPGGLTRLLAERWSAARVLGVDSSSAMIERAAAYAVPGRCDFLRADLREWTPAAPYDVIMSNATLQWVPDHLPLLTRWVDALSADGWLALQVPSNFDAPSHVLLRELADTDRWRPQLDGVLRDGSAVYQPHTYLETLARAGCTVDAWQTTYLHVLPGDDAVLGWVRGTALRPVLDALDDEDTAEFLDAYAGELREAYPREPYGTVFPFQRTFVVARKASA